uniref:Uncharacterized protein n=1 Tax=Arundo donax TaxID=35708 RepID=A0A0A9GAQ6_ARUDO
MELEKIMLFSGLVSGVPTMVKVSILLLLMLIKLRDLVCIISLKSKQVMCKRKSD